ncbi:hypothetical protein [Kineococcus auxinigenes]|uniref:hypothetical protein n=1 Tax=unclassified Kineococcus TaxID=2621656 RepID=UPI003D7DB837
MDFFPDPPPPPEREEEEPAQPAWSGPPEDVLAGVVPLELVLGRSSSTVVTLSGVRAFPTGLSMRLGVRLRGRLSGVDVYDEVFDNAHARVHEPSWRRGRLKWGFELADGRRATNVDPWPGSELPDPHGVPPADWQPARPVLHGGGGGGSPRSVDRDYWLWPLPPPGSLRVVCQWLDQGIEQSVHELDTEVFLQAAQRAQPLWPQG